MIVLGITGSIGMGKSTVSQMLRDMDIPVHDADAAVHALLAAGGAGVAAVGAAFPRALMKDGSGNDYIDRAALGGLVFGDDAARQRLEAILHPMVRADSDAFCEKHRRDGRDIVALDIPLLYETGGEGRVDAVLCVTAGEKTQRARVLARPGMTAEKFANILARQMPDAEKRARADIVVVTDHGFEDTQRQLAAAVGELLKEGKKT
jgi:dephospho-CoA kinase